MASVQISNVSKRYGETAVLQDVSLAVDDGEFLALIGPSGCGKSTLLRIIAGLDAQDDGQVLVGARNVDGRRPKQRDVAMVFQSYALYPHMTAYDNIALPLRVRRLSAAQRFPLLGRLMPGRRAIERDIRRQVDEAAGVLNIGPLLGRKPGQLSGGQRQRVALGRAMVRSPSVFLMDEPLSNLDATLRVQMRAEITALHRRLGVTFIYVTHDQAEAMTMSTRVAVMLDGRILQVDAAERLYRQPEDLRVAEMIGSPKINVVPLRSWETMAAVPARCTAHGIDRIAFRPEAAAIGAVEGASLKGSIEAIENLGADIFVQVRVATCGSTLTVRTDPDGPRFEAGRTVGIHVRPSHLLCYDHRGKLCKSTGQPLSVDTRGA